MTDMFPAVLPDVSAPAAAASASGTDADTVSFEFDFQTGEFVFENGAPKKITGAARVRVWIEKLLRTQLGRYAVYDGTGYGMEYLTWFFGARDRDYIRAELTREVREKISAHPDVTEVKDISVTFTQNGAAVTFACGTKFGSVQGGIALE